MCIIQERYSMFIQPVSYNRHYNKQFAKQNNIISKGGPNPEILKNQLKIMLSQDIWAVKLPVKMPETALEKEALLEILNNRMKLDRFTRLNNTKAALIAKICHANSLLEKDPENNELPELLEEIKNKGNLESVFKTLDKNIKLEAAKNKPALDYFKNLEKLEEEYLQKKIINPSRLNKFWFQIKKNNINADEKYSTEELIEIINSGKNPEIHQPASLNPKPLSKKQVLDKISEQYEQYLRENVNIYDERMTHYDDAQKAQQQIIKTNKEFFKKYPEIEKQVPKIYNYIENKYRYKVDRLMDVDIFPIGEIWKDMDKVESEMKQIKREINNIKAQIDKNPDNTTLKDQLYKKQDELDEARKEWLLGLKYSVKYETENRHRMADKGRLAEYEYLTAENKTIKNHKEVFKMFENCNNKFSDELWAKALNQTTA